MAKITSTSTVVTLPSPSFVLRNVPGAWWASVDARPPGSAPADDADRLPPRCGRPSNVTFLLRTGVGHQPECNLSRARGALQQAPFMAAALQREVENVVERAAAVVPGAHARVLTDGDDAAHPPPVALLAPAVDLHPRPRPTGGGV